MRWRMRPIKAMGFTLLELMLALSLGSLLFAVMRFSPGGLAGMYSAIRRKYGGVGR